MPHMPVGPLFFEPIYKPRIWGGDAIFQHFGRPRIAAEPIGESWELVDLEEGQSVVAAGPAKGLTLRELMTRVGQALMGSVALIDGCFPLLIKFLDARASLSVQVHPSEQAARESGGRARVKHEAWYILAAQPGGWIYHGLEPGVTREAFRQAMLSGRIEGVLRKVMVQPGCCYHLPSGTPHALGAGLLVAEVQTPSDTTYRAYDWGRVDAKGQPRELHLEEALRCIDFDQPSPPPMQTPRRVDDQVVRVAGCPWFTIDRCCAISNIRLPIGGGEPRIWIILEGGGKVDASPLGHSLKPGEVILLPASLVDCFAEFAAGSVWLDVRIPRK